jgi:hypothetical protein
MKNWIKENLVLVIGLALPVLLIVLFFVATVIPKMNSTPPQYEVLFSVPDYNYQSKPDYIIDFKVKNNQLMIKVKKADDKDNYYQNKKLMAYDAKTEVMREISIDNSKFSNDTELLLEETKNMTLSADMLAPDGYRLENQHNNNNGLIGGLFGGGGRNSGYRLKKGNVGYKINAQQNSNYYYYDQLHFIGWVIKK